MTVASLVFTYGSGTSTLCWVLVHDILSFGMYSFNCGCFCNFFSVFVWFLNREVNEKLGKEFLCAHYCLANIHKRKKA